MSDINYTAAGDEFVFVTGLQFESAGVGVTSYIPTEGIPESRTEDVVTISRDNGTYDIAISRGGSVELLTNQVISGGTFSVPTSTSAVAKITTVRKQ